MTVERITEEGKFTKVTDEVQFYKKKMGRPTTYDFVWVSLAYDEYISEYTEEQYLKLERSYSSSYQSSDGDERTSESGSYERKLYVKIPSETSFARYLGVATSTIFEWKKNHPEFAELMNDLLEIQKDFLVNGAISGRFNPMIAKLLLSQHGIIEESTLNNKHSGTLNLAEFFNKKGKDNLIK